MSLTIVLKWSHLWWLLGGLGLVALGAFLALWWVAGFIQPPRW